jgi:hypothetical protein
MNSAKSSDLKNDIFLFLCFFMPGLVFACVEGKAWCERIGWDSVSYLELGDVILRGDWHQALNSYWSPLYGVLLSLLLKVCGSVVKEIYIFTIAGILIFILLSIVFFFFARGLRDTTTNINNSREHISLSPRQLMIALYASFLYCALAICGIRVKTPDLLAAVVCLLFYTIWFAFPNKQASIKRCALLGLLLGVGYLTKHVLFAWGILVIIFTFINYKRYGSTIKHVSTMFICFLITTMVWAVPLSINVGHPTLNDVVSIGQAWGTLTGYMGIVHGRDENFKHPTRQIFQNPDTYEFATPFDVSYPPWFAPAYWYEGVKWKGLVPDFPLYLTRKLNQYISFFIGMWVIGLGALATFNRGLPLSTERLKTYSPIIAPGVICLAMLIFSSDYEGRYYVPFTIPVFSALFATVCLKNNRESRLGKNLVVTMMIIWMLACFIWQFLFQSYFASPAIAKCFRAMVPQKIALPESPPFSPHEATINTLNRLGIQAGDRVARVVRLSGGEFYWARGAKVRVVAECVDVDQFLACSPERRQELYNKLKSIGVKAIVQDWCLTQKPYNPIMEPGWVHVPGTQNWIYVIH